MAVSEKPVPAQASVKLSARARDLLLSQEGILLLFMVIAVVILSALSQPFRQVDNILNQLRLLTEVGLVALPMTFIIITGGIDLSVGSIFGMSVVVLAFSWQDAKLPLELSIVLALVVGTIAGFINGWFIVRVGVPPLIMTLATLALYRGIASGISQGRWAQDFPDWFYALGTRSTLGVPNQVWILLIAAITAAILLARTTFGRSIYAMGNNELAARFAGLPVGRYKIMIYTLSGFMAALAGLIFTSRVNSTRADVGTGLELTAITAVVLGGTSIFGGSGSIAGTVMGVVLIQLLQNGLSLTGVKGDATVVVVGIVLIGAILINNFIQRRRT
jgi:rhamnose transport system permease protein